MHVALGGLVYMGKRGVIIGNLEVFTRNVV